jgi:hypothetical protein
MACPGGCVGGGGQLRGPEKKKTKKVATSTAEDIEGFVRDWAADGVYPSHNGEVPPLPNTPAPATDDARPETAGEAPWSTRTWTREVERAYWGGPAPGNILPTPPASPKRQVGSSSDAGAAERGLEEEAGSALGDLGLDPGSVEALIVRALRELIQRTSDTRDEAGSGAGLETSDKDMASARRRTALFRTQYRAVESEVVGLGVKW